MNFHEETTGYADTETVENNKVNVQFIVDVNLVVSLQGFEIPVKLTNILFEKNFSFFLELII